MEGSTRDIKGYCGLETIKEGVSLYKLKSKINEKNDFYSQESRLLSS